MNFDTGNLCNFVIYEFNLTCEVDNIGNHDFQNASFWTTSFLNRNEGCIFLWVQWFVDYILSYSSKQTPKTLYDSVNIKVILTSWNWFHFDMELVIGNKKGDIS